MSSNRSDAQRIIVVDALRGFALAGVALVHFTEQYLAGPPPEGFLQTVNGPVDQTVQGLIFTLFAGKFYAIFSMLFGLSFSIQMEAAARRGSDFSGRFAWRALLLFVIGYAHQLFYRGDIVTIYAVLAPMLIPFHRLPNRAIVIAALICFMGLPRLLVFAFWGGDSLFGLPPIVGSTEEAIYFETLKTGSLLDVFVANAGYGMQTKFDYQLSPFGRLFLTFGYFLVGLYLGRLRLFHELGTRRNQVRTVLKWAGGAIFLSFILTGLVFTFGPQPMNPNTWYYAVAAAVIDWSNLALATVIVSGFLLLASKPAGRWPKRLAYFAPYGRMALTNYVLQSVIGTALFFGWGLGFIGELRTLLTTVIALSLIALQVEFSRRWLKQYRYGPLEWLWRSATYLRWQRQSVV